MNYRIGISMRQDILWITSIAAINIEKQLEEMKKEFDTQKILW